MSLRTFSFALLLALTGCGAVIPDDDEATIACALDGKAAFENVCRALAVGAGDGWTLTVRHPDGAFRRFLIDSADEVSAADGSEIARSLRHADGRLEIMVGKNRYLLPAPRQ